MQFSVGAAPRLYSFLFSEALLLFVGFIVICIFIVTFTNSTVFPTMTPTMDTLSKMECVLEVELWYFLLASSSLQPWGFKKAKMGKSVFKLLI